MSRDYCIDCPEGTKPRPVSRPGPRCTTHQRARRKNASLSRWSAYILKTYRLTVDQYLILYEKQGRVCGICQRATGRTKRLSVDHDHACCSRPPTCGQCTRGLLCGPCNKLLGHLRDEPGAGLRIFAYLLSNHKLRIKRLGQ